MHWASSVLIRLKKVRDKKGRWPCDMESDWSHEVTSLGMARFAGNYQKLEVARKDPSLGLWTLILT